MAAAPPPFQTATPIVAVALRTAPGGAVVARVGRRTEFGSRLVLGVGERRGGWVGVISSSLPNGRLGWARAGSFRFAAVRYAVRVDLSRRELVLLHGGVVVRRFAVGIGGAGSPTPAGRFTVTDKLAGNRVYGCCILALSGHQPHPPAGWSGGTRMAIHGGPLGAVSAGCLHAAEPSLRYLMRTVPLGTPVTIRD
jgi:hypothetical protein